jgi:hypothetical protein
MKSGQEASERQINAATKLGSKLAFLLPVLAGSRKVQLHLSGEVNG